MGVFIDISKCVGCGGCADICPGNLIKADPDGRAHIRKPDRCWSCASCVKACHAGAISLSLGPEMGGRGARLYAVGEEGGFKWTVARAGEELASFVTRYDEANSY